MLRTLGLFRERCLDTEEEDGVEDKVWTWKIEIEKSSGGWRANKNIRLLVMQVPHIQDSHMPLSTLYAALQWRKTEVLAEVSFNYT